MSVGWICHRTVLVFCSAIVACVAPPYVLGESPNDLVQFQGVGGCAGGSTRCTGFPQTKSSILCRARFVVVALFLIARGVHVHGFVVQFQGVGGCAGRSTRCTKFPQTKSSILWRVQFVVVALFLIARGVPVHEFVVSARHAGLQRGYEHRLFNRISNYLFNCFLNCLFNSLFNRLFNYPIAHFQLAKTDMQCKLRDPMGCWPKPIQPYRKKAWVVVVVVAVGLCFLFFEANCNQSHPAWLSPLSSSPALPGPSSRLVWLPPAPASSSPDIALAAPSSSLCTLQDLLLSLWPSARSYASWLALLSSPSFSSSPSAELPGILRRTPGLLGRCQHPASSGQHGP